MLNITTLIQYSTLYYIVDCDCTCGPCAWLAGSHDRWAGHRSHRTASVVLVCGCHRTSASASTHRGPLQNDRRFFIWDTVQAIICPIHLLGYLGDSCRSLAKLTSKANNIWSHCFNYTKNYTSKCFDWILSVSFNSTFSLNEQFVVCCLCVTLHLITLPAFKVFRPQPW